LEEPSPESLAPPAGSSSTELVPIEVVYALPHRAIVKAFGLKPPATVADALALAVADPAFRGIEFAQAAVGVFGTLARPEQILRAGDRVEIYRPITVDPKAARRARAKQARRAR